MAKQDADDRKKKPSRLGRGLSSLMAAPPAGVSAGSTARAAGVSAVSGGVAEVSGGRVAAGADSGGLGGDYQVIGLGLISPNESQPRRRFEESSLARLAESIGREGLLQPVVVRPVEGGRFELVAGERRWRAAKLAGLEVLPAFVKPLDDQRLAEWALIENLQREDLNPIERAEAFFSLGSIHGLSHEQIAERVGLERSTVTNLLRLLKLSPPVREMVVRGMLSMGQSRSLAGVESPADQLALAERAVQEGWSVRQVESAVKALAKGGAAAKEPAGKAVRAAYLDDLERQIGEQLSTKVQIKTGRKKGAGTLSIDFYSIDEFDGLLARLGVEAQ